MHLGYRWRNSANPLLTNVRTAWDTRDRAAFPAVSPKLGGLTVSYSGLSEGLAQALEFTELRRETAAGGTATRITTRNACHRPTS